MGACKAQDLGPLDAPHLSDPRENRAEEDPLAHAPSMWMKVGGLAIGAMVVAEIEHEGVELPALLARGHKAFLTL